MIPPRLNSVPAWQEMVSRNVNNLATADGAGGVGYGLGRTVQDKLREVVSIKDFGAVGDGAADDRSAIASADTSTATGIEIAVPGGAYKITSNLTISHPMRFVAGGRIVVPNGVTLTLNNSIIAPVSQIFDCQGTGQVVINPAFNLVGYPEWWGCAVGADAYPAITAALAAMTVVRLMRRDYNLSATVVIPPYKRLEGSGQIYEGSTATRLLATGQFTVVQLGQTGYPGSLNACPAGAELVNVFVARNSAPTLAGDSAGVVVGYSRAARLERVWSDTSVNSFRIFGSIACVAVDCRAKRSVISTTNPGDGTSDKWRGWYIDGFSSLGAAGSNASLSLVRCFAELNVTINDANCFNIDGRFTDVFIDEPETTGGAYGIYIAGNRPSGASATNNTDLTIRHPVIDQTTVRGIYIVDVNKWGSLEITEPYIGPSSGEAIRAGNCEGVVSIRGGQIRMNVSTGAAVIFDTCQAPIVDGMIVAECRTQAFVLNAVSGGKIEGTVINETNTLSAAAQLIGTCTQNVIDVAAKGGANKVSIGYQSLNTSNNNNEFRKTRLITSVVAAKTSFAGGAEAASVIYGA